MLELSLPERETFERMMHTGLNDWRVAPVACPKCGKRGLARHIPPQGKQLDPDKIKAVLRCRHCGYEER